MEVTLFRPLTMLQNPRRNLYVPAFVLALLYYTRFFALCKWYFLLFFILFIFAERGQQFAYAFGAFRREIIQHFNGDEPVDVVGVAVMPREYAGQLAQALGQRVFGKIIQVNVIELFDPVQPLERTEIGVRIRVGVIVIEPVFFVFVLQVYLVKAVRCSLCSPLINIFIFFT